jgi:hypothetical protein
MLSKVSKPTLTNTNHNITMPRRWQLLLYHYDNDLGMPNCAALTATNHAVSIAENSYLRQECGFLHNDALQVARRSPRQHASGDVGI